ncbi:MAG: Fe-S cluster assembly scaffold protein NifU [Candidatus Omnitrophica bacterium CG12_big_fil_rev_8_21_14_0_65_43_15]|uniref:Fe-S cluster assembly scaffold protein NifU n=1 Tax=Candidatus Taenaricola geysiri TaxID=1974752 RepID=A0A2J0LE00_9BACT|nr:MAG: Fe-S cluster assembly scaffold protein NifU [Candidatus Omnitrophica bacterium CG1_02_43_210]PIV11836.1 MAG: Fe-S cluster assembly scaffold protein NifU [Candidatus Omnitrophica bacterium CG03_land_8_20_14_0_80_43_22]PIW66081.1 MAG: Fe-S cluster assembly scaffold protein NifU [Candidatus Omnitrophica bacterium CG12_big_fil_rev_8_21_14_0_65_43_15]PIW80701.1 MAG: Fe-S cluster assembly scaffold protein NifU [Candidatus Omnitrophica bacterium CG_4_8_14_3_um_filter_43_15]PIY83110.1 MAG: Fe-S
MPQGPYSEKVMEHFLHPHNVGDMPDANGTGHIGNPTCGDIMELYIKVDEKDIITDAKFKTFGCGAAIATSSMVTELVKGKSIKDALEVSNRAVAEALGGLPKIKMHCSVLAEQALRAAIVDFLKKKNRLNEFPQLKNFKPEDVEREHNG